MIINAKLMMLKINYSDAIGGCDDYNNNDDDDDNDNYDNEFDWCNFQVLEQGQQWSPPLLSAGHCNDDDDDDGDLLFILDVHDQHDCDAD